MEEQKDVAIRSRRTLVELAGTLRDRRNEHPASKLLGDPRSTVRGVCIDNNDFVPLSICLPGLNNRLWRRSRCTRCHAWKSRASFSPRATTHSRHRKKYQSRVTPPSSALLSSEWRSRGSRGVPGPQIASLRDS